MSGKENRRKYVRQTAQPWVTRPENRPEDAGLQALPTSPSPISKLCPLPRPGCSTAAMPTAGPSVATSVPSGVPASWACPPLHQQAGPPGRHPPTSQQEGRESESTGSCPPSPRPQSRVCAFPLEDTGQHCTSDVLFPAPDSASSRLENTCSLHSQVLVGRPPSLTHS